MLYDPNMRFMKVKSKNLEWADGTFIEAASQKSKSKRIVRQILFMHQ
jgi:hypothetical protein